MIASTVSGSPSRRLSSSWQRRRPQRGTSIRLDDSLGATRTAEQRGHFQMAIDRFLVAYEQTYARLWKAEVTDGVDTGRLAWVPIPHGQPRRELAELRSQGTAQDEPADEAWVI